MFFDENNEDNENPVEGLGGEMLPDRGLPFDDDEEEERRSSYPKGSLTQPRDLTPEELADLLGGTFGPTEEEISAMSDTFEEEGGMSAAEPILKDSDIHEVDLPTGEMEIPTTTFVSGMESKGDQVEEPAHLDEEKEMLAHFVTEKRLTQLWERIDIAQKEIKINVPNMPIAQELIKKLEKARNELLAGKRNYEEAERSISEVELRIAVVERAKGDNWAAIALFLYEIIWAALFTSFFLMTSQATEITNIILVTSSAIWGGIGGIAGAFYALWKHVARDVDFSKQYYLWYITNPIMGLILGAFIYLAIQGGLLSMTAETSIQDITSPFIIYLFAFIVGYQQNVAWGLVRRVVQVFQLSGGSERSSTP